MKLESMKPAVAAKVRRALRREFADFFVAMTTETGEGWPAIGQQELCDALADSLLDMGDRTGRGTALLQTFVHELQDRINQRLN